LGAGAGGDFACSSDEVEEGGRLSLDEASEVPVSVERARSAIAIAAAPASSSQVRASMTRELGLLSTPMLRSKRKPLSVRSTWPDARTSATLLALASPPSSAFTRA
jgi:hypothetical protein